MNKRKKILKRIMITLLILGVFLFLNNSSLLTKERNDKPLLLAHRGMAQTFHMEGITGETCTAERIYEPEHNFLENTIPSMEAAFEAGADIVELDIQLTKDGQFAVFHDWTLDCRTNAKGNTREYTMEELKKLDIGYGYTADHGKTHPFRDIPESYTKLLWGWPNKFLNRMDEAGTRVIVVAGDGSWSEGFDRPEDLKRLPESYSGGIWTNRIELIAPVYRKE